MKVFDCAIISSYHQDVLCAEWFFSTMAIEKSCVVLTPNPNEYQALRQQGVNALYLRDYFPNERISEPLVERYFKQKGVTDLPRFVATEKSYYRQSESHLIAYAYRYAYAFERILDEYSIRTFIHPVQGGEVVRRTASLVAQSKSLNVIYLGETFIPGTVNLYTDEYRNVLKPAVAREFPAAEAEAIVRDKIMRKPVVQYTTQKRRFKPTPLPMKMMRLLRDGNWNIIQAYIARKWVIWGEYFVREVYTTLAGVFQPFDASAKYFYFPFNVDAESELFIRNYEYIDQVGAVEKLAKGLPEGYQLYVKIHPGREGHLSIKSYRRLSKIKNVVPLKGSVNSFEVVKASQAVVIISSTVGLESYIMGKPTCIIGHWPYATYGNFVVSRDPTQACNRLLAHAVPNDPIRFLQNVFKESVDGSLYEGPIEFNALVNSIFFKTHLKND
jgi:hypothetical protein